MEPNDYYTYASYCNNIGIKIFARFETVRQVRIVVSHHGKEKVGTELYDQHTDKQRETWSAPIQNLYKQYYNFYKSKEKLNVV